MNGLQSLGNIEVVHQGSDHGLSHKNHQDQSGTGAQSGKARTAAVQPVGQGQKDQAGAAVHQNSRLELRDLPRTGRIKTPLVDKIVDAFTNTGSEHCLPQQKGCKHHKTPEHRAKLLVGRGRFGPP